MADFYEVWLCRGTVLDKLEALLDAREAAREEELKAATDIKRVYRGKVKRQPFPNSSRPFVYIDVALLETCCASGVCDSAITCTSLHEGQTDWNYVCTLRA